MKKINKITIIALTLTSLTMFPVHADGEHATYAIIDANGIVLNAIVCGPAVCGPDGAWGGIMPNDTPWAGQRLVLQFPENSETKSSLGGVVSTAEQPVIYNDQTQLFTQTYTPVINTEIIDNVKLSATIESNAITFGPNTVINNEVQRTHVITPTTGAVISAFEFTGETRTVTTETGYVFTENIFNQIETETFTSPKTRSQIQASIENKLRKIQQYLNRFYILLNGWLVE
jgi:hypothetical protein